MSPISMDQIRLDVLSPGQHAFIDDITAQGETRRRFQELGFTPGASVTCLMRAPSGDPAAYRIRSAVIALRREDAKKIRLRFQKTSHPEVGVNGG